MNHRSQWSHHGSNTSFIQHDPSIDGIWHKYMGMYQNQSCYGGMNIHLPVIWASLGYQSVLTHTLIWSDFRGLSAGRTFESRRVVGGRQPSDSPWSPSLWIRRSTSDVEKKLCGEWRAWGSVENWHVCSIFEHVWWTSQYVWSHVYWYQQAEDLNHFNLAWWLYSVDSHRWTSWEYSKRIQEASKRVRDTMGSRCIGKHQHHQWQWKLLKYKNKWPPAEQILKHGR